MALHAPMAGVNERICNFGVAGVGKSYDFYTIPRLAAKTHSDAQFFIIDTDASAEMMLSDSAFDPITNDNVFVEHVYDWDSLMAALTRFQGELKGPGFVDGLMGPNDWLLIDMLTPAWQWAQDWYTNKVFGKNLDEYFIAKRIEAARKPNSDDGPFEGSKDWTHINGEYNKLATRILRSPGHVFVTAEQKGVPKNADQVTRIDFGPIGFVPAGQKRTPHLFHSCFHKRVSLQGEYLITSAKNRSREKLESVVVNDFAVNVLVRNRGWKLA